MDDIHLTSKEKAAIKQLKGALRSLPSKLVLRVDAEGDLVVTKSGVSERDFRQVLSESIAPPLR